jgi:hypothetical protein
LLPLAPACSSDEPTTAPPDPAAELRFVAVAESTRLLALDRIEEGVPDGLVDEAFLFESSEPFPDLPGAQRASVFAVADNVLVRPADGTSSVLFSSGPGSRDELAAMATGGLSTVPVDWIVTTTELDGRPLDELTVAYEDHGGPIWMDPETGGGGGGGPQCRNFGPVNCNCRPNGSWCCAYGEDCYENGEWRRKRSWWDCGAGGVCTP